MVEKEYEKINHIHNKPTEIFTKYFLKNHNLRNNIIHNEAIQYNC